MKEDHKTKEAIFKLLQAAMDGQVGVSEHKHAFEVIYKRMTQRFSHNQDLKDSLHEMIADGSLIKILGNFSVAKAIEAYLISSVYKYKCRRYSKKVKEVALETIAEPTGPTPRPGINKAALFQKFEELQPTSNRLYKSICHLFEERVLPAKKGQPFAMAEKELQEKIWGGCQKVKGACFRSKECSLSTDNCCLFRGKYVRDSWRKCCKNLPKKDVIVYKPPVKA